MNVRATALSSCLFALAACNAAAPSERASGPERGAEDADRSSPARDAGTVSGGRDTEGGTTPADVRADDTRDDAPDGETSGGTPDASSDATDDAALDTATDASLDAPDGAMEDASMPDVEEPDVAEPDTAEPDVEDCDADRDGAIAVACGGDDCDDTDRDRAPGRGEVCDFKDNDCDEVVNQGLDCRVYAHSSSTLYLVDPFLGTQTVVSSAPSLWDFDTSADGTLYGVTSGRRLVRFDEASRDWITVGNIGSTSTANGFAIDGDNRAFMTGGDQLYQIDLATAETVLVGNMGTDPRGRLYNSSGDCVVDKTDALWMTSSHAATDEFVRVDADSGEAESVGETGFGGLWGLTAAYGYIFAFSSAGEIILLDERTGEGTLVHTISGVSFYGAASSPER